MDWGRVGNTTLTVGCLALTAFVLVRPRGPIGVAWKDWRERRAIAQIVTDSTDAAQAVGTALSAAEAKIPVLEFSDYECPYCRATHRPLMDGLKRDAALSVVYIHFPLAQHPAAKGAGFAQVCAKNQGMGQAYHELLMSTEEWRADTAWARLANLVGVADTVAFARCLVSDSTRRIVERGMNLARLLKVSGTPTFVGPGGLHVGVVNDTILRELK